MSFPYFGVLFNEYRKQNIKLFKAGDFIAELTPHIMPLICLKQLIITYIRAWAFSRFWGRNGTEARGAPESSERRGVF
jgi:hypothetical protein